MSRKRVSVFDRLGPGNDGEREPSRRSPVRHRRYPDKPSDKSVSEERSRDKRLSEPDRLPRKHRHDDVDTPPSARLQPSAKREKAPPPARKSELKPHRTKRHRSSSSHSSTEAAESEGEDKEKKRRLPKRSKSLRDTSSSRTADKRDTHEGNLEGGSRREPHHSSHRPDEDRTRRKREYEGSLSDSDVGHRESKRPKLDETHGSSSHQSERPHKERSKANLDKAAPKEKPPPPSSSSSQPKKKKKRSLYDSLSESDGDSSILDWANIAKQSFPRLQLKETGSCLDEYRPGAIFSHIGVSPSLIPDSLRVQVEKACGEYMKEKYPYVNTSNLLEKLFQAHDVAAVISSGLQSSVDELGTLYNIGPCRRGLTADVDYMMRKKLKESGRKADYGSSSVPSGTWNSHLYSTSLSLYKSSV